MAGAFSIWGGVGILIGIGTAFIASGYSNINFYGAIAAFAAGH
jgi:hypothetical protein